MAVWIYAYGRNRTTTETDNQYLEILNTIPLDELKILDSVLETKGSDFSIRQYYTNNRKQIEDGYKSMTVDEYKSYLDSIKLPFIKIEDIVDHFISDGEKREQERKNHFQFAYNEFNSKRVKSKWELSDSGLFVNKLGYFGSHDGLRLRLMNDLVWISGPFSVFSVYSTFLSIISETSREYYHSYFKAILRAFKSDFILYTHEWAGLDDEDDKEFNTVKLKEQSNWEASSSNSIHTMSSYYYEKL